MSTSTNAERSTSRETTPGRYTGLSPEQFDAFRARVRHTWNHLGGLHIGLSFFLGADGTMKLAAKLPRGLSQASKDAKGTGIEEGAAATMRFPSLFPLDHKPTDEDIDRANTRINEYLPRLREEATFQVRHQCALEGIAVTMLDAIPLHP